MKLKITEAGFETYSGFIGQIEFKDGMSVRDVTVVENNIVSALMRVNWVKDGEDVGRAEPKSVGFDMSAPVEPSRAVKPVAQEKTVVVPKYSREELEKIADKSGLAGLREIGDKLGVKATSITKMIELILSKQ